MLIGIVGKANVGKSTFFKAATLAEAEIANYPFTTIEPNRAFAYVKVPCPETLFNVKCNPQHGFCIKGQRFVPVEMLDVAGLVPGAHLGKGRGNTFLDDLRQADVLIHVVDISGSTNEKGEAVAAGAYDPLNDVRFLEEELAMWLFGMIKRNWVKFSRQAEMESKPIEQAIANQLSGLNISLQTVKDAVQSANLAGKKASTWSDEDVKAFSGHVRKKGKPIIIAANKIDVPVGRTNYERLKKEFKDYMVVPCSSEVELALREAAKTELIGYIPGESDFSVKNESKLSEKQSRALDFVKGFLKEHEQTGVQECLNSAVFDFLKYIVVFPGGVSKLGDSKGNILPDAFLFPPGTTAYDFAAKIHQDLAEGFVKAIDVRTKKAVGRDHVLKNLDIVEIISKK